MKEITLTVKTVTPTLMGGAFSQNDGIRPSEIKGMMRYWFRAVAGCFIYHFPKDKFQKDLDILKKFESKIFGNTVQASSFKLIISNKANFEELAHLPHKKWSKDNPKFIIPQNTNFQLKILIKNIPFEKTKMDEYKNFLENLIQLSFFFGIGFRKNRFFGNMYLENKSIKIDNLIKSLKFFISNKFQEYGNFYKTEKKKILFPNFPTFSIRNEENQNFYINNILNGCYISNWENFLKNFYEKIIHKIKEDSNLKPFIDGGILDKNLHKTSLINFSYFDNKIYLTSFFFDNRGFLRKLDDYKKWQKGLEEIEKIIKNSELCKNES